MKIEVFTVSVNYSDLLRVTLPLNIGQIENYTVVTEEEDWQTREVCRQYNVKTLISKDHKLDGAVFNKGRLIDRGLQMASNDAWRLHLDADIVLPNTFRHQLRAAHLDPRKIYGCDRVMIRSYEQWVAFQACGWRTHDYHYRVQSPEGYEIGTRWVHPDYGYHPIGFFQLWHSSADTHNGIRHRTYPHTHNDAARSDIKHSSQWDRCDRELIPELYVIHLESELASNGINWQGRKTKPFGNPSNGTGVSY